MSIVNRSGVTLPMYRSMEDEDGEVHLTRERITAWQLLFFCEQAGECTVGLKNHMRMHGSNINDKGGYLVL